MSRILTSLKGQEREALLAYSGPVERIEQGFFRDTLPNIWQIRNAKYRPRGGPGTTAWVATAVLMRQQGASTAEIAKMVNRSPKTVRAVLVDRMRQAVGEGA